MSTPREWILRKGDFQPRELDGSFIYNGEDYYRVIEKTPEVVRKLECFDELVEALEFYANEMNYSVDDYQGISGEMRKRCVLYKDLEERNDVYSYAGKLARETLKKAKGE
jgi:hypothetical protein